MLFRLSLTPLFLLLSISLFGSESFGHLTYVGGNGRGYKGGYEAAGISIYNPGECCSLRFLELQMIRVAPGRFAGNCGIGWRQTLQTVDALFGLNFFYDYRREGGVYFQQIAAGMEYFNPLFDFRMNGYLPIVRDKGIGTTTITEFESEETEIVTTYDAPFWGLDVELSTILKVGGIHTLLVGAGPYFYDTLCNCYVSDALLGGMFRVKAQVSRQFTAEFFITYDRFFHFASQGIFTWRKSFGGRGPPCCLSDDRVFRNPVIVTSGKHAIYQDYY